LLHCSMQRATWPARQRQPEIRFFPLKSRFAYSVPAKGIFAETLNAKYLDIKDVNAFIHSVVKA